MRTLLRSAAFLVMALAAHCGAAAPVFAQSPGAESAMSYKPPAMNAATPADFPTPEPVPAPSAAAVALAEPNERQRLTAVVDEWFAKHFHGLGPNLTEYLHGRLLAAVDDLKELLLELPIS